MSDRMTTRWVALGCLALLAIAESGCAYDLVPPPPTVTYAAYRVGPPDQLTIVVLPEPTMERTVVIRPDGMISMDLIGDVPAIGRTVDEISADIERRISRFKRDASVTVFLVAAASTEVTIFGEVRSPTAFPLQKDTRVAEAIGRVGGETLFANPRKIRVVRSGGGETAVYDVNLSAIRAGDLSTNIELVTGDIVYVPPSIFARIGYAINALLLPFQPVLGIVQSGIGASLAK